MFEADKERVDGEQSLIPRDLSDRLYMLALALALIENPNVTNKAVGDLLGKHGYAKRVSTGITPQVRARLKRVLQGAAFDKPILEGPNSNHQVFSTMNSGWFEADLAAPQNEPEQADSAPKQDSPVSVPSSQEELFQFQDEQDRVRWVLESKLRLATELVTGFIEKDMQKDLLQRAKAMRKEQGYPNDVNSLLDRVLLADADREAHAVARDILARFALNDRYDLKRAGDLVPLVLRAHGGSWADVEQLVKARLGRTNKRALGQAKMHL
jgi:hypothetical protein